jgi:hypothetical protein
MGESIEFSRFIGLQITDAVLPDLVENPKFYDRNNDIGGIDGIQFIIQSAPMGEAPHWLVPLKAHSICVMSRSHWDGHGGGAEEYDYNADPLSTSEQATANKHDAKIVNKLKMALTKAGFKTGRIVNVLGWTSTWPDVWNRDYHTTPGAVIQSLNPYCPMINRSEKIVSYGPWDITGEDEEPANSYYQLQIQMPSTSILGMPYGKKLYKSHPAIPIRRYNHGS